MRSVAASDIPIGELAELTMALVACPSPNPTGDETAVVDALRRFLGAEGSIETTTYEFSPNRPSLVASIGRGSPCLALAAHTDTHAIGTGWTHEPLGHADSDGRLYGRGTTDDKGAVAAMSLAFRTVARAYQGQPGRLLLIANADEETGGEAGVAPLVLNWSERPDAAVVAEASGVFESWENLWTAARGTTRFTITIRGTPTHSSLAGRDGVRSAIESLLSLLPEVEARLGLLRRAHPTFGLGSRLTVVRLEGGDGWGGVPGEAVAKCELRLLPPATQAEAESAARKAVDEGMRAVGTSAELEFAHGGLRWMSPSEAPPASRIVKIAEAAWTDVFRRPPVAGCFPGATDARLFEAAGIPCVVVGPGALVRAHHADEFVTTDELATAYRLYVNLAARFLGWEVNADGVAD